MAHRADIDALRAFAVLGVLLFHLDLPQFGAGFLGVDAFFVISGYLMTSIILRDLEAGTFSPASFFLRRARRILPALFATIALTMIGCLFILPPAPLRTAGAEGVSAVFAVSNILFWRQAGYFDAASSYKPLLHTWSLGVEEQFYLFWTCALMIFAYLGIGRRRLPLVLIGMLSAGAAILFQTELFWTLFPFIGYTDGASAAFFLMPFRIWEFAIGAVLAEPFVRKREASSSVKLFGLLLLIGSYISAAYLDQYPAVIGSMVACGGAALVIHTANGGPTAAMMAWRPITYIGRISYSIYLVHWPLIVLYKWSTGPELGLNEVVYLFALSIVLGASMHHLVEQPLRYGVVGPSDARSLPIGSIAIGVLLISAISASAAANFGMGASAPFHLPSRADLAATAKNTYQYDDRRCDIDSYLATKPGTGCTYGNTFDILTVGNSHEPHGYSLVRNLLTARIDGRDVNAVYAGTHTRGKAGQDEDFRCNFNRLKSLPLRSPNPRCEVLADYLNDRGTAEKFDALVVASYKPLDWGPIYLDLALRMQQDNPALKVIVIGSFYGLDEKFRCSDLVEHSGDLLACSNRSLLGYYNPDEEREIRQRWPSLDFQYIDQRAAMCASADFETCSTTVDGVPFFYDSHHFHSLGTAIMADHLRSRGEANGLMQYLATAPAP